MTSFALTKAAKTQLQSTPAVAEAHTHNNNCHVSRSRSRYHRWDSVV